MQYEAVYLTAAIILFHGLNDIPVPIMKPSPELVDPGIVLWRNMRQFRRRDKIQPLEQLEDCIPLSTPPIDPGDFSLDLLTVRLSLHH